MMCNMKWDIPQKSSEVNMKERYIFAPEANGSELLKSLAMHGVNCINLHICGATELANIALMRSGITVKEAFLTSKEECALIAGAVEGEAYFGKINYSDIQTIADAVRRMRSLVVSDEASEIERCLGLGIFEDKNKALLNVYKKYIAKVKALCSIDSVELIRKAIAEAEAMDAEFCVLKEFPLNPLQTALLNKISDGKFDEISIAELYDKGDKPLHLEHIWNCYGAPNEVEKVLSAIYRGTALDECTIAVTNPSTYSQLFFDYALLYDMPITFGTGIPIINSNPARLLKLYFNWMTSGFFSGYSLNNMLDSKVFNRQKLWEQFSETDENFDRNTFRNILGGIRFTNSSEVNAERLSAFKDTVAEEEKLLDATDTKAIREYNRKKACIPLLEVMAAELSAPAEIFITKYSVVRMGSSTNAEKLLMKLDLAANGAIYEELKVIRDSGLNQGADDVIANVLKMNICREKSEEGALHITGIRGALTSLRKNLYIMGLSASMFPGAPKENYLLLDDDLKKFGKGSETMTSSGRIEAKRQALYSLAGLASSLDNSVSLSYAGLNVSELKKDNASSMVFELFRREHGENVTSRDLESSVEKVEYFEPAISVSREIGKTYNEGTVAIPQKYIDRIKQEEGDVEKSNYPSVWDKQRRYSPSALEKFFSCPKAFMYGYVLGIPEPEDDKPFETIAAHAVGTLAHSLMEELGKNQKMPLNDFLILSEEFFDRYMLQNPPLLKENIAVEKDAFLEMMETAYGMEQHREIILKEEDIEATHEQGVIIHGYPDRVEKMDDGSIVIVDFKTKKKIEHHPEEDLGPCLQLLVYAYLMENKGYKKIRCEYRYIRLGEVVAFDWNDEAKDMLDYLLGEFKATMQEGYFAKGIVVDEENSPCTFCKYQGICGRGGGNI